VVAFVPVRDFRVNPSAVWDALEANRRVIVTTHGQPTALMLKVDGESWQDTLKAVEQAEWTGLLTRLQVQADVAGARDLSLDEINAEIAAARAEHPHGD